VHGFFEPPLHDANHAQASARFGAHVEQLRPLSLFERRLGRLRTRLELAILASDTAK
jgi:hypothetical protein